MPRHQQSRPAFGLSMESQTGSPTSPSAIFTEPRTPNSWTVRSFTTLGPSDSPSQAQFPKHSQASLLLGPQRERARATGGTKEASPAKKQLHQPSFFKRNFRFIALAVMFQIALAGITTMVVLIIAAAKSKPPKRIKPGYYTGLMLSFACGIASIILGYVKWNERKTSSPGEGTCPGVNELNCAEFGLALSPLPPRSPMDDTRAIVSNWEHSTPAARHHHLNTLMATRNPLPSASARIAGSSNRPFPQPPFITDRSIELASLSPYPRHHHQRHEPATDTALELQRFIDHELQRQELIKRRISAWLHGIVSPPVQEQQQQQEQQPPPPPPPSSQRRHHHRRRHRPPQSFTHIPSNPLRLADLTREIESYIGIPIPPLPLATAPDYGDANIDYSVLPPAIPRPGAKARDVVLSDPTTVVYVGPDPRAGAGLGARDRGLGAKGKEVAGGTKEAGFGGGNGREGNRGVGFQASEDRGNGERGRDDFAERWVRRVVEGVDVGGGVSVSGGGKKRGGVLRGMKFW